MSIRTMAISSRGRDAGFSSADDGQVEGQA
jgi:hypothetical protein